MGYYDMNKDDRRKLVLQMEDEIKQDLQNSQKRDILHYSADDDVYIRKNVSGIMGRIYRKGLFKGEIIEIVGYLLENDDDKVRQTAV